MNKRRVKRAVLLTGLMGLLLAGSFGLWVRSYRRQEDLNRQLIAALVKQDPKQALALVNAGADPNTPFKPPSPPSLRQLWNHMVHRTALPGNATLNAFHLACGANTYSKIPSDNAIGLNTDEPHLVEMMLQHGAQKNAGKGNRWTPLFWSVVSEHPKTMDVLLKHGVDVNAKDKKGWTVLWWALLANYPTANPSKRIKEANIVRQLLAHGADPNRPGWNGETPLQEAHEVNRPDLVTLLRKAGAKQ